MACPLCTWDGGQHFIYADIKGDIAYFTNAEVPIREDLQAARLMVDFDTRKRWAGPASTSSPSPASPTRRIGAISSFSPTSVPLDLAASDDFAFAFGGSTDRRRHRWGKLHRIRLVSPLGAPYTVPSAGNRFTSPLPGLPGIPVDGGFNVPDTATFSLWADEPDRSVAAGGPIRRLVAGDTARLAFGEFARRRRQRRPRRQVEQNLPRGWLTTSVRVPPTSPATADRPAARA